MLSVLLFATVLLPHSVKSTCSTLTANVEDAAAIPGTAVVYECCVTGNILIWISPAFDDGYIAFIRPRDNVGFTQTSSSTFAAVLTNKGTTTLNSSLQFSAIQGLNGTVFNCSNTSLPYMSQTLLIAGTPMSPNNISIMNYTLSSVILMWSAPAFDGLSRITGYLVSVSRRQLIVANLSTVSTASTSITIPSLQHSAPYTFEVKAVNRVGASLGAFVYNFTIVPEGLNAPSNLTTQTFCGGIGGHLKVSFTWEIPKLGSMTLPLLFISLNYSMGCNRSNHVKLPPATNSYTIDDVPAGTNIFATVSAFNEMQESTSNPTVEEGTDCHLSAEVVSIGSTNVTVHCEECGIDTTNSACVVLYKECSNHSVEERATVGYLVNGLFSVYKVILVDLAPDKTYCFRANLVCHTSSACDCHQTYGLFRTRQQFQETNSYLNDEIKASAAVPIIAGTGAGAFIVGMFLASVVCCCVMWCRRAKTAVPAKTFQVHVPGTVNKLCVKLKELEDVPSLSNPLHQDDYVHMYDHVFEVSTNSAYGNVATKTSP